MAVNTFSIELQSVIMYKFGALSNSYSIKPDAKNSINIIPQVQEITIYESVASAILRAEIAIVDTVGLFTNFPFSGEEVICIRYRNTSDPGQEKNEEATAGDFEELFFVIDSVRDINIDDSSRGVAYIIKCVAIEAFVNSIYSIQQAYDGTIPDIIRRVYDEHIVSQVRKFFPQFKSNILNMDNNEVQTSTVVIPNMRPFVALDMLSKLAVAEAGNSHTYMFYQTMEGFRFKSLQNMISGNNAKRYALKNSYKYFSNEVDERSSTLNNKERIVSFLSVVKRHASLEKIAMGYFNNTRYEINLAQKAIWPEKVSYETDITHINSNKLNTDAYMKATKDLLDDDDMSNRSKYVLTTRREHDTDFPVSRLRDRWGKDIVAMASMSQIHLVATIAGTNRFNAGDLFHLEVPEMHAFNDVGKDDLITGFYLISEIKHILRIGGLHSTVLTLNKDSYDESIDRDSKYGTK